MLEFFYQSLETLQEVKKPSKDEVIKMTVAVLVIVILSAMLFAVVDFVLLHLHNDILYKFLNSLFN
jgi:preprotein translocase SecE subunit